MAAAGTDGGYAGGGNGDNADNDDLPKAVPFPFSSD